MKLRSGLCVIVSLVACSDSAIAGVLTGPVINPANGHSYYLLEQDTWTNSQAFAQTLGGHLVTINDVAENQWISDTFQDINGSRLNLWIGFNDIEEEGVFEWISGESVTFSNFGMNEPTGDSPDVSPQDYVRMNGLSSFNPSAWADNGNDPTFDVYGLVEVVPEPASFTVLGLGGLALLRRTRRA